jgi:hypothetical protein
MRNPHTDTLRAMITQVERDPAKAIQVKDLETGHVGLVYCLEGEWYLMDKEERPKPTIVGLMYFIDPEFTSFSVVDKPQPEPKESDIYFPPQ